MAALAERNRQLERREPEAVVEGLRSRVASLSTADQNLDAQIAALEAAGCTMVRTETGDGATLAGRPKLGTILEFIHPGETLVVTRIDRLARSMRDLQVIVATLKDKGVHLAATEQPVDTSTAAGKAFFDMLGVFAESETNQRRERQAEGIAAAKQHGAYRGRPPRGVPKSVGSNGQTVLRLKGERAFEVDVWTLNRRCRLL